MNSSFPPPPHGPHNVGIAPAGGAVPLHYGHQYSRKFPWGLNWLGPVLLCCSVRIQDAFVIYYWNSQCFSGPQSTLQVSIASQANRRHIQSYLPYGLCSLQFGLLGVLPVCKKQEPTHGWLSFAWKSDLWCFNACRTKYCIFLSWRYLPTPSCFLWLVKKLAYLNLSSVYPWSTFTNMINF